MLLVPQALLGFAQLDLQLAEALAAKVLQLHALEVFPDSLVGIEIGCVARELLKHKSPGSPSGEKVLYRPSAMYRRAVPYDEQLTGYSAHKVPQKAHYVFSFEDSLLLHHVELALQGDAAEHLKR